ncbi:MAG: DUF4351 domain-containing protein [Planctomycetaceae bacterium]|jgi:flagellar biosynthesis/type III secretory pathway protein FliH|nr:DUF4351 domain-containing protein [Planctomycetaceae bacterium]
MFISTLEKKFIQGIQEGIQEGIQKGKTQDILKILNKRFKSVPDSVVQSLNSYTDIIALDSLFELALDCENLTEFEQALAH